MFIRRQTSEPQSADDGGDYDGDDVFFSSSWSLCSPEKAKTLHNVSTLILDLGRLWRWWGKTTGWCRFNRINDWSWSIQDRLGLLRLGGCSRRKELEYWRCAGLVVCVTDWRTAEPFCTSSSSFSTSFSSSSPPSPPGLPFRYPPPRCWWFTALTHHGSTWQSRWTTGLVPTHFCPSTFHHHHHHPSPVILMYRTELQLFDL